MTKRIYPLLAALVVAVALAAPVHAATSSSQLQRSEAVAKASDAAAVWHRPHRGYLVQDRRQMHTEVVPRLGVTLSHCRGDARCQATAVAYYADLHHQWRVLNGNLWTLVAGLPRCSSSVVTNCALRNGAVALGPWWFAANQRPVFAG